jgi:hypothetical protein
MANKSDLLPHKETPCYKCEERQENCHSSCKRYLEFKDKSGKSYYARLLQKNPYSVEAQMFFKSKSQEG